MAMAEIKVPIYVNLPDDWIEQIVNRLRNDPEAEWAEVVRCKDCKYCKYWKHDHTCSEHALVSPMCANEFCSRAERKDGD